jgi:hypothetical protein
VISSGTAELDLRAGASDCPSAYNEFADQATPNRDVTIEQGRRVRGAKIVILAALVDCAVAIQSPFTWHHFLS